MVTNTWLFRFDKDRRKLVKSFLHTHDFDEVLAFFVTNPEDIYDLWGEVRLWLEDEQYLLIKSFILYILKDLHNILWELSGLTGLFFQEQNSACLLEVLRKFKSNDFNPQLIREKAMDFDQERFKERIKEFINRAGH